LESAFLRGFLGGGWVTDFLKREVSSRYEDDNIKDKGSHSVGERWRRKDATAAEGKGCNCPSSLLKGSFRKGSKV
jgi:hypothetical protein